ncbi:hypothetical protein CgunFtcFv8_010291 [Champsocephalus gunnari]|uniref:Uncharacterized protein n=1 Tax=Champsocephalus gunnari TaxID=52237 RepID=A0AAN8DTL7_CHAGU|nr:hypothetical protein CgunFtcFv8_010291 [Champsocephalus gunnari]
MSTRALYYLQHLTCTKPRATSHSLLKESAVREVEVARYEGIWQQPLRAARLHRSPSLRAGSGPGPSLWPRSGLRAGQKLHHIPEEHRCTSDLLRCAKCTT